MDQHQLYQMLVQRYLNNTASKEELELFFHLLQAGKLDEYLEQIGDTSPRQLNVEHNTQKQKKIFKLNTVIRYAVAASLIAAIATGIVNYKKSSSSQGLVSQNVVQPKAPPGTKKAVLTLSDGRNISLEQLHQTLHDGGAEIVAGNNSLVYHSNAVSEISYNTITIPKGGEYQFTLPDGSQVWLNAESSLRYPTAFAGADRVVELAGEAYFEVAKNPKQPFIVHTNNTAIKVLGTHFNVMAYSDEPFVKTTLAEGAVLLQKNGHEQKLNPGEGGTILNNSDDIIVAPANIEQDLAWKNGNFYFSKTELETIMKQIGRWYDVDIHYAGAIPKKRFVGKISRHTNLSDVLDVLRLSEIRFSMTGKILTVENQ